MCIASLACFIWPRQLYTLFHVSEFLPFYNKIKLVKLIFYTAFALVKGNFLCMFFNTKVQKVCEMEQCAAARNSLICAIRPTTCHSPFQAITHISFKASKKEEGKNVVIIEKGKGDLAKLFSGQVWKRNSLLDYLFKAKYSID